MVSKFYQKNGRKILWLVGLTFPLLLLESRSLRSNNDIDTWLPHHAEIRRTYDDFKRQFGADEVVLVAFPAEKADPRLTESIAARLEASPGVQQCWTSERMRNALRDMRVPDDEIDERLRGFVVSEDGKTLGLIAVLSRTGLENRLATVGQIRRELAYCQFDGEDVALAGPPVVVAELDRLGGSKQNQKFFFITLLISLGLLYYSLRDWKLALSILGITVWAINLTMTIVKHTGGEMNFILGALSVMVMVFTLAICVHVLHYFRAAQNDDDPLGAALRVAWKPCCLATLTTTIGLLSLTVSDIPAVQMFGTAASVGSVVALFTGLCVMPAALAVWPPDDRYEVKAQSRFARAAHELLNHKGKVALVTGLLVAISSVGLFRLQSRIEPLDFLPGDNRVLNDVLHVESRLTKMNSIEAVVDFGNDKSAFVDKLATIREIEAKIAGHPCVFKTSSPATFFPTQLPDDPMVTADLLQTAEKRWEGNNDYIADGGNRWRISARIGATADRPRKQIIAELNEMTAGRSVTYTGMAPLLEQAQASIFEGFWDSFLTAFGIITLVMIVSLRSWKTGMVAMIPNLTPLCIVFGILGWLRIPVDIGMMMTGSIALGIAVDGTFHYLLHYESRYRLHADSEAAARDALIQTGAPILKAATIAAIGMLALALSNFVPTARFGYMMATLLMAALIGDLVLLPAVLALRPGSRKNDDDDGKQPEARERHIPAPHLFADRTPVDRRRPMESARDRFQPVE